MPTPTLVTVTGNFDPDASVSVLRFKIPVTLRYQLGVDMITPSTIQANIQPDGSFSVQVYATNDPNWAPVDWAYDIVLLGQDLRQYYQVQVDYHTTNVAFSSLLPLAAASDQRLYAAVGHTHPSTSAPVLVLATGAPVPGGTAAGTVIVRT